MRTLVAFLVAVILVLPFSAADEPAFRTWSDTTGSFKLDAQLVKFAGESVTLRRKDGKEITLPLAKLSKSDQEFLKNGSGGKSAKTFELPSRPVARTLGTATLVKEWSTDVQTLPSLEKTPPLLAVPALEPLPADPASGLMPTKSYAVAVTEVDAYDKISRPICIDAGSGAIALSVGRRVAGQPVARGRIYRMGYGIRQAELLLDVTESVDLLAHDLQTGRTLLVAGRDELYRGGELILMEGLVEGAVKVRCRRALPGMDKPGFKPNVESASLVNNLAIVAVDSNVYAWNLEANQLVYQIALNPGEKISTSPGGKYLAIGSNGKVTILDAANGEALGQFGTGTTLIPQLMFDPTGTKLAIGMDNRLDVWDLTTAQADSQQTLFSPVGEMIGWVQPGLLLTSLAGLVDLNLEMGVWNYSLPHPERCQCIEGGLIACDEQKGYLVANVLSVPHPPAIRFRSRLSNGAAKDLVVQPGTTVSIRIDTKQNVDKDAIKVAMQTAAEKAGWTVKPRAPIELVAVIGRGEPKTLSYRMSSGPGGAGGQEETATITPFTSELQIQRAGKVLWSRATSNYVPSVLFMTNGQTLQQEVSKFEKPDATFFEKLNLPPRIINPDLRKGLGQSRLSEGNWAD